jgi:prefoldin alpha subunit
MNQEELIYTFGIYEQQIKNLQEQLESVNRGISDLELLNVDLEDLKGSIGKDIMAPVGRGIFIKSKIISEELNVDIGGGNFVKKSVDETKEIINSQIKKLEKVKNELEDSIKKMNSRIEELIKEVENLS